MVLFSLFRMVVTISHRTATNYYLLTITKCKNDIFKCLVPANNAKTPNIQFIIIVIVIIIIIIII